MTADTIFSSEQASELIVLLLTSDEKVQFMAEVFLSSSRTGFARSRPASAVEISKRPV